MSDLVYGRYEAFIEGIESVHDGDTLMRVHILLPGIQRTPHAPLGEIYPDLLVREDGVWMRINVRLEGIDAPEIHPHHSFPEGSPRPPEDIEYERELAAKARDVVASLIEANGLKFVLRNLQIGKYADRIVAQVWTPNPDTGFLTNVSKYLLQQNLAYEYDGGTKKVWTKNARSA